MQKSNSLKMTSLKGILKRLIKPQVMDIYLIGSSFKNKLAPQDIDLIFHFNEKNHSKNSEVLFYAKEKLNLPNIHIESIYSSSLLTEPIFLTILHEGFSIKYNKKVSDMLGLKSFIQFSYDLKSLDKIKKVRFSQALYGRKKEGLLYQEKGISLGKGAIQIPVEKEELFKELFDIWGVKYKRKRVFVND